MKQSENVYKLSFGTIIIINNQLAEVIIDEEVEMNVELVDTYHDFLLSHLRAPFSLLINKKFSYSYTFEAQKIIANIEEIDYMAVLVGTLGSTLATKTIISLKDRENIKIFVTREEALTWLSDQQNKKAVI
ncbi:hypothetical protein [Psychroserpens ponticola]|uniref:STAS/SEC14 domain-containing protein n=1 Tax=Psychroserpens ponticola TaxID=2932268 RepID=A0ABY7RZ33_9FLAO|nr:hypothetical protein [Psychroserpens ponticola]WCO02394.1 hypothetical protein MUN68_002620 [Psychroserpens ponticola]